MIIPKLRARIDSKTFHGSSDLWRAKLSPRSHWAFLSFCDHHFCKGHLWADDSLLLLKGIKEVTNKKLIAVGIKTIVDFMSLTEDKLKTAIKNGSRLPGRTLLQLRATVTLSTDNKHGTK